MKRLRIRRGAIQLNSICENFSASVVRDFSVRFDKFVYRLRFAVV